jgi:hypothetical protein
MPPVGFKPTISVLLRAKTVLALERATTAIGSYILYTVHYAVRASILLPLSGPLSQRAIAVLVCV